MDLTPPRSKLSCKKTELKNESGPSESIASTPTLRKNDQDNEYSPIYFQATQESNEDIDVFWDWHSPQTGERRRKKQKRLIPVQHSPSIPIKRHPSHNRNQNFEKLREELKLLQEELAMPDENCLCVSPQQETEFKTEDHLDNNFQLEQEQQLDNFNDVFNDSIDEELVLFSQQVEKDLLESKSTKNNSHVDSKKQDSVFECDNSDIDNLINKYTKENNKVDYKMKGETVNRALSTPHVDNFPKTNNALNNKKFTFQRTHSDNSFSKNTTNVIQTMSGKLELHRTKSFEMEANGSQIKLPKSKLEEIERKRLEALAKLTSKKKQEGTNSGTTQLSPQKCSPEEIERKRLQALAKREAKRLEEIVEKKRQEALKKLQASRMKNANLVKSTLTTRL